jgi:hypothetical protein
VACLCGKTVRVPSLSELRRLAGEELFSPEFELEQLLASGCPPVTDNCACCRDRGGTTVHCWVICARPWLRHTGDLSVPALILSILLLPRLITLFLLSRRGETKEYGKDVRFLVPLRVCDNCRTGLRKPREIKEVLRRTSRIYARLLDKYPEAEVSLKQ